jgi:hypothetical protein
MAKGGVSMEKLEAIGYARTRAQGFKSGRSPPSPGHRDFDAAHERAEVRRPRHGPDEANATRSASASRRNGC